MKLKYTRAIIDAIHSGELSAAETQPTAIFELQASSQPSAACQSHAASLRQSSDHE